MDKQLNYMIFIKMHINKKFSLLVNRSKFNKRKLKNKHFFILKYVATINKY